MERYYELFRDSLSYTTAEYADNNAFFAHFHTAIEVMYVESGEICVIQNGVSTLVSEQSLIVNSCYTLHSYHTPASSRVIVSVIPLSAVPSLRSLLLKNSFAQGVVSTQNMKECRRILRMMADPANRENHTFVNLLSEALLSYLIAKIGLVEAADDTRKDLMKEILLYLQVHAAEPITVADVAEHFGYSKGRFSHIFSERIGCSFTRYLHSVRCQMAQVLLKENELSLLDIANFCGFNSIRTFHRVYKALTGETPRSGQGY